ncbi:hypothetical protein [Janibacter sp. UYMM211]|uniref:hypothetical protein n=1 Tax=Janibacter sp. UYMM211 TaxID=3156342 RepID=UPI003397DB61
MSERPEQHETAYSEHADGTEAPQPPQPGPGEDQPTRAETSYSEHADDESAPEGPEAHPS